MAGWRTQELQKELAFKASLALNDCECNIDFCDRTCYGKIKSFFRASG